MGRRESKIPADFLPLTLVLPESDRQAILGYRGEASFVGFFWEAELGGVVWYDGRDEALGHGENFTFTRFIRPLAFLYNVNFGSRGPRATHLLVWDRQTAAGYVAPRQSAFRFLSCQNLNDQSDLVDASPLVV